jgi:soluble lytic murein transglycosylase
MTEQNNRKKQRARPTPRADTQPCSRPSCARPHLRFDRRTRHRFKAFPLSGRWGTGHDKAAMHMCRDNPVSAPHRLKWMAACLLGAVVLTSTRAATPGDPLATQRNEFRQALSRVASISATAAATDSADLRNYALYPYLQAARLGQELVASGIGVTTALDDRIAAFLRAHEGKTVAQDLRRNWLASLAARNRWSQFLAFHRDATDGAALRCHGFSARIEQQRTEGLAAEVVQAWLTPRSVPECERAFNWLRDNSGLSNELIEQRVRLALEGGNAAFARQILRPLPGDLAAPLLQWAALLENPRREIDALIAAPQTAVDSRALLASWTSLARADRAAARQRFEKLLSARKLDRQSAGPYALALGLALSWDRDPDALKYFARADAADFDDSAREWEARAALWAGDWKQVSRSITAMSEDARRTARWRYWTARAAAQDGNEASARQLYESILTDDNYYSAMAAARLRRKAIPTLQTVPLDAAQVSSLENLPEFVRARELRLSGLVPYAQAEWRSAQDSLQPPVRAQTIHLASRWGWHDQAVASATGERVFNDYKLLYPRPYDAEVAAAAGFSGLSLDLIYGVIRQESLYRSDAVSSADARGLMQLLPETARRTARQSNLPVPSAADLFEPAINVMLGAAHVKELLDRFGGQLPLALAGYNAGPGAAQRWLPSRAMDPDIWIENIPYNETRTYVQRILWHTVVFGWLRDGQPRETSEMLTAVNPASTRQ